MSKFLHRILTLLLICAKSANSNICINSKDPCHCQLNEFSEIDLEGATQSSKDDTNFLEDVISNGITYYFHGCTDGVFNSTARHLNSTEKIHRGSLISVALVYNETLNAIQYQVNVVGNSADIHFNNAKGEAHNYQLSYVRNETVVASVYLICDDFKTPFIKFLSNDINKSVSLALSSPAACVQTHPRGMSTGSILLILVFVSFGVYFVGGCAVLYIMRGARGLEVVPNIDFWRSLPGLVKAGAIFLFSGCSTHSVSTPETYDRI